jgi:hypothetical protein
MTAPRLVTASQERKTPVLLIDSNGVLAEHLATELSHEFLPVLVSGREPSRELANSSIYIPLKRTPPRLPDNTFSYIFVVYNGESVIRGMLPVLLAKAKEMRATIVIAMSMYHATEHAAKQLLSQGDLVKVVLLGEVFGERALPNYGFNELLDGVETTGTLHIAGNGLVSLYPVHIVDAVQGILKVAFGNQGSSFFYLLFPKYEVTPLALMRLLKKQHPLLSVVFHSKQKMKSAPFYMPPEGLLLLPEAYPLGKRLQTITLPKRQPATKRQAKRHIKSIRLVSPGKGLSVGFLFIIIFLFPLLIVAGSAMAGGVMLTQAIRAIERNDLVQAEQYVVLGKQAFGMGNTTAGLLPKVGFVDSMQETMQLGEQVGEVGVTVVAGLREYAAIFENPNGEKKGQFIEATNKMKQAAFTLKQLQAEDKIPEPYKSQLSSYELPIQYFLTMADVMPYVLGFEKEMVYLVLFQNNMELRPGGGFIGSYGLLRVRNAQIADFTIHDVYDADGKLLEHIEPPFFLRRYLGVKHLFLRDSNTATDFPKSAKQAAHILNLETGDRVDGVIGIDTQMLKKLLAVTGPITIPEYSESVSADNFFDRLESRAQDNFFPGSTQKKDYLRSVAAALKEQLITKKKIGSPQLVKVLAEAVEQKHLMFAFPDHAVQSVFTVNDMAGALWDTRAQKTGVINDFLQISEANIGLNKTNFYLQRFIEHEVKITPDGGVIGAVTLTYTNSATSNSKFGGDYKQYLRFYLPKGTELVSVKVGGSDIPVTAAVTDPAVYEQARFTPPSGLEVESVQEAGKQTFGFLTIIPTATTQKVTIVYREPSLPTPIPPSFTYDLKVLKQQGTLQDPYVFRMAFPEGYTILTPPDDMTIDGTSAFQTRTLAEDFDFSLQFSRK